MNMNMKMKIKVMMKINPVYYPPTCKRFSCSLCCIFLFKPSLRLYLQYSDTFMVGPGNNVQFYESGSEATKGRLCPRLLRGQATG